MRKNKLLIVLFTSLTTLLFAVVSCTYDYFEDETNYLLFVPQVLENSITDCRVMVYNEAGVLVGERYATTPSWGGDSRMQQGLFGFRLPPGEYKVYCYTNTDSINFVDSRALEASAFLLNEKEVGSNSYVQPSDILFQKLTPIIVHPGILTTDTTDIERYIGRITVRFKDFPADASRITNVMLRAQGAATMQFLKEDTLTTRRSESDIMFDLDKLPLQTRSGDIVEVDHRYLPTVDDGKIVQLEYTFLDASGSTVIRLPLELADINTKIPTRLLHGRRLIIEVDSYTIVSISLVGWDEDIQGGGETNLE